MRYLIIVLSLFLITCGGGGGGGPTEPEGPTYVVNLTLLSGNAQKGPFNNGTAINIAELTTTLSPTGRNFSTAITDNTGRFSVANVQLTSPYVELRANGFYFNEISNNLSEAQLTLYALSNLSGKTSLNVNILTHLEKNRMTTLMSGENPKTFAQAKLQAQEEVFAIFDYSRANVPESELLDISQGGAANGKLLAISAIVQGNLSVAQMSELLANISTDIASDGTLDDATLRNTLIDNSKNLDLAQIRANLEARYISLGISATIPDFETEVNQFLKPPVVQDINASTNEDVAINITLAGSDPEGEALTYTIVDVNNATVTLNNNVANYLPDANFNGTDTFTYYANDGTSDSNIATVTMTVNAEDDDPNTQNVSATTDEDVAVVIQLAAEEYDGDSYSFSIVDNPTNGTASLDGSTVTYTPNQDFNGTDTFTFEATDDTGRFMNVGTATITINPINDAPVLVTTSVTESVNEEASVDITITATDVDGDQLTFHWNNNDWSGGSDVEVQGDITINGNIFTFAANPNTELAEGVTTTGQFYYLAQDSEYNSNVGLATVTITGVDDFPHADDIYDVSVYENSTANIRLTSTDPDGGDNSNIQYEITESPSNGTATFATNDDSLVIYTPNTDFHGTDTFKYKVTGDNHEATVDLVIHEIVGDAIIVDIDFDYFLYGDDVIHHQGLNEFIYVGAMKHKHTSSIPKKNFIVRYNEDLTLKSSSYEITGFSDAVFDNGYDNSDLQILELQGSTDILVYETGNGVSWGWGGQGEHTKIFSIAQDNTLNWLFDLGEWSNSNPSPDNIKDFAMGSIVESDDGGFVVSGVARRVISGPDEEPKVIAVKLNSDGSVAYYNIFDSSFGNTYQAGGIARIIKSNESNKYFIASSNYKINWNTGHYLSVYEIEDTGSGFTKINQYNEPNPDSASSDAPNLSAVGIVKNNISGTATDFYVVGTANNDFIIRRYVVDNESMTKSSEFHGIGIQDFIDSKIELVADSNNPGVVYMCANSTTRHMYLYKFNDSSVEWNGFPNSIFPGKSVTWNFGGIDMIDSGQYSNHIIINGNANNNTDEVNGLGYIQILDSNGE